jgi:hypothetical protein
MDRKQANAVQLVGMMPDEVADEHTEWMAELLTACLTVRT